MLVHQFNPVNGEVCPVCGKNEVKDSTNICIDGTQHGNDCDQVQVHVDCLINGLVLYKGETGSVIGKSAPFYTTEEVEESQIEA